MIQLCNVKKPIKNKAKSKSKPGLKDTDLKKLGERIKQLRIAKGYTSYEYFAYEHNLGRAQFGRYERGTEDLRYSSLLKIIKAFDMNLEEFFSEGFD
jgi:hypothetical protein